MLGLVEEGGHNYENECSCIARIFILAVAMGTGLEPPCSPHTHKPYPQSPFHSHTVLPHSLSSSSYNEMEGFCCRKKHRLKAESKEPENFTSAIFSSIFSLEERNIMRDRLGERLIDR